MAAHEPKLHTRPSGTYMVDGMQLVEQAVTLTFPETFEIVELRGVAVAATVFAIRQRDDYQLWCEFKHSADGRWRSVFARREWVSGAELSASAPAKRAFKRPR